MDGNTNCKRLDARIMDADNFMLEESCGPLAAKVRIGLIRALDWVSRPQPPAAATAAAATAAASASTIV